jgi:hypothetical protein
MSTANNTMENALKQAITAAVKKLEFKKYDVPEDNVVDCFLTDLFGILFPNNSGLVKERKKPGPKPKLDEHGNPIRSPRKSKKSSEGPAAAGAGSPVKERKKPGPKPKLDADGNPVSKKAKAKKEPGERKKPGPKPKLDADGNPVGKKAKAKKAAAKPLPPSPAASPKKAGAPKPNVEWSPTLTKRVKPIIKELNIELRLTPAKQKELAAHLNAMAKSEYDAKTFEEHMRDYLRPAAATPAPPAPKAGGAAAAGDDSDDEETSVRVVSFKGKKYSVDPSDKAVYDEDATEHLGYVGSGEFVGMVVPDDDDAESDSGSEDDE